MGQSPRVAWGLRIFAGILVLIALLISGLRLALPHLNQWREPLLTQVRSWTGVPLDIGMLQGRWLAAGPQLTLENVTLNLPKLQVQVARVEGRLNLWQSLLQRRWQFSSLIFSGVRLDSRYPWRASEPAGNDNDRQALRRLDELVFDQLSQFELQDSQFRFITPSGEPLLLTVNRLGWHNGQRRHQAQGSIVLAGGGQNYGALDLRFDLYDGVHRLESGQIYLHGEQLDLTPWLTQRGARLSGLQSAQLSVSAWLTIADNRMQQGLLQLENGRSLWGQGSDTHSLSFRRLQVQLQRTDDLLTARVPQLALQTDQQPWPLSALQATYQQDQLQIQSSALDLALISPLLPAAVPEIPALRVLQQMQPHGELSALNLTLPLTKLENTTLNARFAHVGIRGGEQWPALTDITGDIQGSLAAARLQVRAGPHSVLTYPQQFPEPITLAGSEVDLQATFGEQGWQLRSERVDLRSPYLQFNGRFRLDWPRAQAPWLGILGGINLNQAAQAWRYYPRGLMGNALTDYLTPTLQAGHVQGATLVWSGDPLQFPYQGNDGVFQVAVPVRQAVFQFDPKWLPLRDLDLDLLFEDDRLLMHSTQARLGAARATRIEASIDPLHADANLKIDASVQGRAPEVQYYLTHSPLRDSVGTALQEIQLQGPVKGALQLSIPLSGAQADAKGRVWLDNNALRLKSLDLVLSGVKGDFRFDNGNLRSQPLQARLWQQPVTLDFTTHQQQQNYTIDVGLKGNWQVSQLPQAWNTPLWQQLSGRLSWQGKVAVQLPASGGARYQVNLDGGLGAVRSRLPAPLDNAAWQGQRWQATAKGDLKRFTVQANWGALARFQGAWQVGAQASLQRAWLDVGPVNSKPRPAGAMVLTANLPSLNLDAWQDMLVPAVSNLSRSTPTPAGWLGYLPDYLQLDTGTLQLGGQRWDNLALNGRLQGDSYQLKALGQQIRGTATLHRQAPWRIDLAYLNWRSPNSSAVSSPALGSAASRPILATSNRAASSSAAQTTDFRRWPALRLRCNDCQIDGQAFKRVQADLTPSAQALTLSNGLIDTGLGTLTFDGAWRGGRGQAVLTTVGGRLQTPNLAALLTHFGVATSLRDTPTDLTFTLRWPGAPWQLDLSQLGGSLSLKARKGMISEVGGRTGQVLRLVSTDSLLRKLRLDFSDAFEEGFFYDKITGTASITRGILRTDNLLIDGLLADIALRGDMNLYRRTINMDAVIAPELGAGLSVATAFMVNPVAGLAVFAASQALSPLWSKLSLLRYHIEGNMDNPQVQETQRIEKGDF